MAKHMAPIPKDDANNEAVGQTSQQPVAQAPVPPVDGPDPALDASSAYSPVFDTELPNKKRRNLVSNILIAVGVVLLVVAGVIFFRNNQNYQKIDESNERVAEYARLSDDSHQPPAVDWAALHEINPDIVGWLEVPGTVVNYPVCQAPDNDYYLNHAPDRTDSIGGSVFLDYENTSPGLVDAQTIVYGHHMRNGSQFKQIADMDSQERFDGVDTVWYVTEQGAFELAPLFLYYTSEEDTDVRQFSFPDVEAYRAYLNGYLGQAVARRANAEEAVRVVNHVFTLSTCNYYDGYGRSLLVCGLKSEIPGTPQYDAVQAQAQAAAEQPAPEDQPEEAEQPEAEPEQPVE